jgi:hypothetical protein
MRYEAGKCRALANRYTTNDTELIEKEKKEKKVMYFGDLFCGFSILRDVQHSWSA